MKRGTVCWVNLEPASPPESGKTRPALIVSNSDQNLFLQSVVVLPLSSQAGEIWPLRLRLKISHGKIFYAILPAIRQVSKTRLQEIVGMAGPADMERVDEALSCYLGD
jgi:mRNA-degrading endonuclease toxin of MazEF toxin-antitoxin module